MNQEKFIKILKEAWKAQICKQWWEAMFKWLLAAGSWEVNSRLFFSISSIRGPWHPRTTLMWAVFNQSECTMRMKRSPDQIMPNKQMSWGHKSWPHHSVIKSISLLRERQICRFNTARTWTRFLAPSSFFPAGFFPHPASVLGCHSTWHHFDSLVRR